MGMGQNLLLYHIWGNTCNHPLTSHSRVPVPALTHSHSHIIIHHLYHLYVDVFPQQQNFAMGSLNQISSGAIRCSFNTRFRTRFRRVLVQIPREILEGPVQILLCNKQLSACAVKIKCLCHEKKTSEPFGVSQSICARTLRNLTRYLHQNPPEPHQASSPPKPSQTSEGLCTGTFRNLTRYLHHPSEPSPSIFSAKTLRHLRRPLRWNLPEPHKVSAPEPSGTSPRIFT